MNKTNIAPFTLEGWPLDLVDQTQMRELRMIADEKGLSLTDVIDDAMRLFVAQHNAARDANDKIVKFPAP